MKKLLIIIAAAYFAVLAAAQADTSYLLIQGAFGDGGSTETFLWQVNYQAGTLVTGQDLLTAVLGSTSLNGTYADGFASTYNYYTSGNSTQGAAFIDFGSSTSSPPAQPVTPFVVSFTLGGTTVAQDPSYSPGWTYYVAGGAGTNGSDNLGGAYPDGTWSFSDDGGYNRTLTNGSFDGYVFGSTSDSPSIAGFDPTVTDFAGATVINVIPEPRSTALLIFGAGGMLLLLKKRRRA
ncbi:MAG: PEP-CTERM sorting domain-containing protein [Chthoniobacteraceae bacterium]